MQSTLSLDQEDSSLAWLSGSRPVWLIAGIAIALFLMRIWAPPNLLDQDQENPATYVLDVVKNGHWVCQRDLAGNITSKPPLYTWLASVSTLLIGEVNVVSLYLPGGLSLGATACLMFLAGRGYFGARAGFFAALACMLCTAGLKQFGLARTDGVFAFTVTVAALLAWRSWMLGRGWTWFWLAGAAATLTKGPLGPVLASLGLLANLWERGSGDPWPVRGRHYLGVTLFAACTVGWVAAAYLSLGHAVVEKLLFRELLFHAVEGEQKALPGSLIYLSPLYYLGRCAPWSLFAYCGLWRTWRTPASDTTERRFERFLFCWFVGGLFIFSMSPHQRGDLLWPIMPAGALLAGRELSRLTARARPQVVERATIAVALLAVAGFSFYYMVPRGQTRFVRQTIAVRRVAKEIERRGGREFPLTHTDDPIGLQVYLNTYRPPVTLERAAELLRGPGAAFVAVNNRAALESLRRPGDSPLHVLISDNGPVPKLGVSIVSNRPDFAVPDEAALAWGPWTVWYRGQLKAAYGDNFELVSEKSLSVTITNEGQDTQALRLCIHEAGSARTEIRQVPRGQTISVSGRAEH